MKRDLLLTDATVLTMDAERRCYRSGFVWMREGRIHAVGAMSALAEAPAGTEVRSLPGHVVLPALVNGHTHLSNGILRGFYDEMPLEFWVAGGMWNTMRAMDGEAAAAGAALSLEELLLSGVGTTAVGEFGIPDPEWPDGVLAEVRRSGMRAVVSRMTLDSPDESCASQAVPAEFRETPERAIREVERLRSAWASDLVSVVPEALGVLRCTAKMIGALHEFAVAEKLHLFLHCASSQDERDEARRRLGHGSVTELDRLGALGPRTLLAHAIWLDDGEIGLLAEHGTGVSHNPVSNASYAAGVARLPELLEAGVRVGLGVDGASTNNGQNLWETMKMAIFLQKQRREDAHFGSAELALELATIGGARALHMESEIGSLEAGKRADVLCIDTTRPRLVPRVTAVSSLVYSNDPGAVRHLFVDGVELVRDGACLTLDGGRIREEADRAAERLFRATGLEGLAAGRTRWRWLG